MINSLLSLFASGSCPGAPLFNIFPTWYEYLPGTVDSAGKCTPGLAHLTDIWLIVAAIIDILLRLASLAAVVFIIYGGILYATSQSSPEQTSQAKSTIINALVGLVFSISAAVIVSFIAGSFK